MTNKLSNLLTYAEAAIELGVTHWTVRNFVRRRKLRCVRMSHTVRRISRAAIAKFLEASER